MALAQFVDRIVARVRETPVDLAGLQPESIRGSLFSGGSGVAFFLLEAARLRGEEDLVPLAERWWELSAKWAATASKQDWKDLPWGLLIGASGVSYVDALLGVRAGDPARVLRGAQGIEKSSASFVGLRGDFRPTELVAGAAGVACGTRDLLARIPVGAEYEAARELLRRISERTSAAVLEGHAEPIDAEDTASRGLAHGLAGELWSLVATAGPRHPAVRARLAEFERLREIDEDGLVYWLPSRGSEDTTMLGTWCNGMAGLSLLWTEVARQTRSAKSLRLAGQAAESVHVLLSPNPSLCCGLTGQAMALQRYADVSGDARFAKRAYARLSRAAARYESFGDTYALGLWQGALGGALAAMTRIHGQRTFPCIEPLLPSAGR